MNINNDNYEEYFLLYADNELSAEQRKIVEMFVKTNPQLRREWEDLIATIQKPEEISFADKSMLFKKPVDSFIDSFNYEKRFVEYHDGELSEEEKSFVHAFLIDHPELKTVFDLISQSYLTSDKNIVFGNKDLLYHKSTFVRYAMVARFAAAAALIGIIFWLGNGVFQKSANTPVGNIVQNNSAPVIPQKADSKSASEQAESSHQKISVTRSEQHFVQAKSPESRMPSEEKGANENKTSKPALLQYPEALQPQTELAGMVPEKGKTTPLILRSSLSLEAAEPITHASEKVTVRNSVLKPEYALSSQDAVQNDFVFTDIPAENLKRSKLGVFITKVKRTIDRNNPVNRIFNGEDE